MKIYTDNQKLYQFSFYENNPYTELDISNDTILFFLFFLYNQIQKNNRSRKKKLLKRKV